MQNKTQATAEGLEKLFIAELVQGLPPTAGLLDSQPCRGTKNQELALSLDGIAFYCSVFLPREKTADLDKEQNNKFTSHKSVLQKSPTLSFRRKPESRIARKYWIPGRVSLARNDDFLLLSRVLQEAHNLKYENTLGVIPAKAGI